MPERGQLYTVGYAALGASEQLEELMDDPLMLLVDIRYAAVSRWYPKWSKKQLQERWGDRYTHEQRLGNVNYKRRDLPIQLYNPEQSVAGIVHLLEQGKSVVLLCACSDYETCHRKVVVDRVITAWSELVTQRLNAEL